MPQLDPLTLTAHPSVRNQPWLWLVPVVLACILVLFSLHSYLLFHTLAEFFSIIVAITLAIVAWQMYPFTRNNFLLYLGSGYFWIACLDLAHALSYKGMNIHQFAIGDSAVQFWIGTRFIEAILLLSAPLFLKRQLYPGISFSLYGLASILLTVTIINDRFPTTFIDGQGLTTFKVYSEYLIILLLIGALSFLWTQRHRLEQRILKLMMLSILFTMCAELAFTFYVSVYGFSNLVGHLFKFFSFWMIFVAMIRTTLQEPFLAMSRGANTYDAIPDATVVVDDDGNIRQANQQACIVTGLTADKIVGQNNHQLFHDRNQSVSECPVCQSIAKAKASGSIELKRNDSNQWFDISLSPISGLYGQHGMVQVLRDITQRKYTEEALRRNQKMEAIGLLSGGIAHDFNNQLGVITGYLEMLKDQCQNRDKPGRWIETSLNAAQRCIDLTRQLLIISKQKPYRKQSTGINQVINDMTSIISRTLSDEIETSYHLASGLWATELDQGEFQDALLNMVINARDAMPDGGQLVVKTSNFSISDDNAQQHPGLDHGEYILLQIHDSGHGMDRQIQQSAFDPFFTTKKEGKGTGMGLAMVYGFIKRHQGEVLIHSSPTEGCRFDIYLPRGRNPESHSLFPTAEQTEGMSGNEIILLVDDEVDLLELASLYLQEMGYQVLTAQCADEALGILSGNQDIDLLFTDVVMPEKNGFELVEEALKQKPNLKYLFTTGHIRKDLYEKQFDQHQEHTLQKPYTRDDVVQIIRKRLDS